MEKTIRVLHLDTQMTWRGGQQQAFYLHKCLLEKNSFSLMLCQPNSEMAKRCDLEHKAFITVKMRNEVDLIAVYHIFRLIIKKKLNIIHCHSAHALSIGLILKLLAPKLILIGSRRVDFPIRTHFFSRIKYSSSLVNKIVCISNNIKQVMIKSGINEKKLELIHSGIDINRYQNLITNELPSELANLENKTIIGTIAALVGHKDYPTLLKAAKLILEKRNDCIFIAVGDGRDKDKLLALKEELNLSDRFIFCGYRHNIKDYLASFDLFVLSSKLEGLGTSVLDAMSAGIPIVACASGGIPEMINHKHNGLLAERENFEDLAEKLNYALDNMQEMQEFANRSKEIVKNFSIDNTVNKNIELYKRLINEKL